ncbi:zinc finger, CCHC-type containing protein [Tanacetum coccineum]
MDVKIEFLNGEMDEEVYMNQPYGFIMPSNEDKVVMTKEFLSSMFSMKDMGEDDVFLCIRIKNESNGIAISQSHYIEKVVSQLEYSRVVGCLIYVMTCIRPVMAFVVGKLSRSTLEFEFVALEVAGKEVEWLRNLILEIPLWSKPIALISIRCDSASTLSKAYSQMYNGKSRHLAFRYSMIRELITNRVVSIEFVRSQQNLADHLTKGLAKDLVLKSAEGMGLKFNLVHPENTSEIILSLVKKVDYPVDHDSEDEVASVDNDMARFIASEKVGFGKDRDLNNHGLLEQWRDTYENDDYDYDPYDDDVYEGQDFPDKIQAMCDNLDIKV